MTERITEEDWIKPLVLLRGLAEDLGFTLSDAEEQAICRRVVEAVTTALADEVQARADALAAAAKVS